MQAIVVISDTILQHDGLRDKAARWQHISHNVYSECTATCTTYPVIVTQLKITMECTDIMLVHLKHYRHQSFASTLSINGHIAVILQSLCSCVTERRIASKFLFIISGLCILETVNIPVDYIRVVLRAH